MTVAKARTFPLVAAIFVTGVGALALTGWILDVHRLKSFYGGGGITMKANAALSLLLAGSSLWILVAASPRVAARRVGQVCALLITVVGALTLSQHLIGWDLGIDQLLFREPPGALATSSPGRMGPPASTCFTLAGIALLLLHANRRFVLAQSLAIGVCVLALLGVIGYTYRADPLYSAAHYTGIALHTAVALLMLSLGLITARSEHGITAVLSGSGAGSVFARRLLVFATVTPFLLGWLRLQGQWAGYYDLSFGTAALVMAIIVIMATLIWDSAGRLNQMEQRRLAAEASERGNAAALAERLQEIETMMEVAPTGLLLSLDAETARIVGNRAARDFLRMERGTNANLSLSASDEAPAHFRVMKDGVEVAPDELPIQRAVREGIAVLNTELDIVFDDGSVKHELISALPLFDSAGNPRGAVASLMDVTQQRRAAREREELLAREQEMRVQAEAANRAKDEFLATVSHELRTPLNAILGWATLLRGRIPDEATVDEALATIERNCRLQAQLIEDLLDVSRINAGKLRLDVRPVDLAVVVRAALDAVRPAAHAKGINVHVPADSPHASVLGDPTRIQQIMWNLLSNAVKFTPRGGSVGVTIDVTDADATITVSDIGEGISSEFLPFVFDRFRQADGTKTRRHGGLGLGLSIARHLVEAHGGTIDARSDGLGKGATFAVRLPLLSSEAATFLAKSR